MAKATIKMPDELLVKLSRLGAKSDEIAAMALEAGGQVVLDKVKANLESVIGSDTKYDSRSTGELVESLGLTPAKIDRNGNFNVKIGFAEPRSDGESNAMIATVLEYGKHGQPPKPFMEPAKTESKTECKKVMKAVLEREVAKL